MRMFGFLSVFFSKAASFCRASASCSGCRITGYMLSAGFTSCRCRYWPGWSKPGAADVLGQSGARGCGCEHRDCGLKAPVSESFSQCFHDFLINVRKVNVDDNIDLLMHPEQVGPVSRAC